MDGGGGHSGVLLAPAAVVTYRKVRPLLPSDLPLFVARRHDEASALSIAHVDAKWRITSACTDRFLQKNVVCKNKVVCKKMFYGIIDVYTRTP